MLRDQSQEMLSSCDTGELPGEGAKVSICIYLTAGSLQQIFRGITGLQRGRRTCTVIVDV